MVSIAIRVCLAGVFLACVTGLSERALGETPAPRGRGTGASLYEFLYSPSSLLLAADPDRSDPPPEEPLPFPKGFRPEPWETWEVPDELRRISFALFGGLSNFFRDARALKADNPSLTGMVSEDVDYQSLWDPESIGGTICIGFSVMPLVSLYYEGSFTPYRKEVSPPTTYVTYVDSDNYQKVISAENIQVFTGCLCLQLAFPVNQFLFEPENLFRWRHPAGREGFVPFLLIGAGLSYFGGADININRVEGGVPSTETRHLYKATWNFCALLGIGLEYRISLLGFTARMELMDHGAPRPAWRPYAADAESLLTLQMQLGISLYLL
ncbi:MAG: hypothetical protein ACYTHM_20550 [Planctomycetota bacterium]|jgi:hypothetical protein